MMPGGRRRPSEPSGDPDDGAYYSRTYHSSRLRRPGDRRGDDRYRGSGGGRPPKTPRTRKPRRRGSTARTIVGVLALILVILALPYAIVLGVTYGKLNRIDVLQDYEGRPEKTPGQDWLLVGSDSREGLSKKEQRELHTGHTGGRRADTMMLLHIPRGDGKPTLVSFPRDSYVPIPGRGRMKLNAAYAIGGPKLAVRTIEQVTDIRIDHYMEVGFAGFAGAVDAAGGVDICVKRKMKDPKQKITFKKGCQTMDGKTGLAYVRSRYDDPRGDFGRVERQREFLAALFSKAASPATLLNPIRAGRIAFASADGLTVDKSDGLIDLFSLALTMRKASGGGVKTLTVPVAGTETVAGQGSVVRWDRPKARKLLSQLRNDQRVTVKG